MTAENKIVNPVRNREGSQRSFISNGTTKIISSFLIISMILPSVLFSLPKQVEAQNPAAVPTDSVKQNFWANFLDHPIQTITSSRFADQTETSRCYSRSCPLYF